MTGARAGHRSRPASSHGLSAAYDIHKRREKPYRVEKQKFVVKKDGMEYHTNYKQAPPGYTFVAMGTAQLSDRCKELSREEKVPVYIVNAREGNKHAHEPNKVSYHVHRIGYHFRSSIVEQACEELGYVHYRNAFVTPRELQDQVNNNKIASLLESRGVAWNTGSIAQETPDKVRAAIKELFPKIPDEDLEHIVKHAWQENSGRVGTNQTLDLSRRVQLATVARIRHAYTDYDNLLKAFHEWSAVRAEVEPATLEKLIEWRGEKWGNDEVLQEIVRETIVIDDDDEDDGHVQRGRRRGGADEPYATDTSDASIEFTQHIAGAEDLGAESHDESGMHLLQRFRPQPIYRTAEQNNLARQKIEEARKRLQAEIVQVNVEMNSQGLPPNMIMVEGKLYQRDPADIPPPPPSSAPLPLPPPSLQGRSWNPPRYQPATQAVASARQSWHLPVSSPTESHPSGLIVRSIEAAPPGYPVLQRHHELPQQILPPHPAAQYNQTPLPAPTYQPAYENRRWEPVTNAGRYAQLPPQQGSPVHGAPAPVQQLARQGGNVAAPPANGAPHPAQYYYVR